MMRPRFAARRGALSTLLLFLAFAAQSVFAGIPFDVDGDGLVDLADYHRLATCLTVSGPQVPTGSLCQAVRFDLDSDVDLFDFSGFQNAFTGSGASNDACAAAIRVSDGTRTFSNVGATTDGPDEPTVCSFFNRTQVESDLWYCYTATCSGTATVSLCGSDYDTKLAVYAGCGCPSAPATACSDDDCGIGIENIQSRVEVLVTAGSEYLIRAGAFETEEGGGLLTVGCNVDACANGTGDCLAPSPTEGPGCGDAACCASTCEVDTFCCDVSWDVTCAGEAEGLCDGHFAACAPGSGSCGQEDATRGCDDAPCCDLVCRTDPYCCLTTWDVKCVDEAQAQCLLTCVAGAGDCGTVHLTPGCDNRTCCEIICPDNPFCCDTEWDQFCVDIAAKSCP